MKTPERFNRAIKALVDAYFNNELMKGSCSHCAVGNIVAACNPDLIKEHSQHPNWVRSLWSYVFMTDTSGDQRVEQRNYRDYARETIDNTGYSWRELAKVEKAFEKNTVYGHPEYNNLPNSLISFDQYNGLMAVVDVLCEIEGMDQQTLKETKNLFEKTV